MKPRYAGIMQTFWNNTRIFIDGMNDATEKAKTIPRFRLLKSDKNLVKRSLIGKLLF